MNRLWMVSLNIVLLALAATMPAHGQSRRGIVGELAPPLDVKTWVSGGSVELEQLRGKVVYMYCFQSWCPGCHSHGFPTLKSLINKYKGRDDVAFLAVQTVFEGYSTNTASAALRTAKRYDLSIPVGHDGSAGNRSGVMRRFRTGGTPWAIVIDKEGVVQFNGFRLSVDQATAMIDNMLQWPTVPRLEKSRGGQDLIGTRFPKLRFEQVAADRKKSHAPIKPQATLYRWWTDTCPYCTASLPALEKLRIKYADRGLRVVSVYHPKPLRAIDPVQVQQAARAMGFNGDVVIDKDWSQLERAWRSSNELTATSVSFLVDKHGTIRFVHPGPEFFSSDKPEDAVPNADYEALDKAVDAVLWSPLDKMRK